MTYLMAWVKDVSRAGRERSFSRKHHTQVSGRNEKGPVDAGQLRKQHPVSLASRWATTVRAQPPGASHQQSLSTKDAKPAFLSVFFLLFSFLLIKKGYG